ncbi:MAG: hypothetical protein OES12_10170 [Anaerolineae bacterium]|nr:hypothetical protein [Anaerolineae bacterium]
MSTMIQISPETYALLQRRAQEIQSTPEQIAETAIRLQLGNTIHMGCTKSVLPGGYFENGRLL